MNLENKNKVLDYFDGNELAANVWLDKYCLKDELGNYIEETPDDMHHRLASEYARIEKKYPNPMSEDEIYKLLKNFKYFIPAGSPMFGIGNKYTISSLANCFVIGNDDNSDSYGSIMRLDEETAQIQKRRGGVGLDISFIRPKGSKVHNAANYSEGVVPYMERYSNTTKEVAQSGRRGAEMISISCYHPDTGDFIDAKMNLGKVTGANISVRISDEFMNKIENDSDFIQRFPIDTNLDDIGITKEQVDKYEYDKLYTYTYQNKIYYIKKVKAKLIWDKLMFNAWKSAEPGILYWDTIINNSFGDKYSDLGFKTTGVNPCAELALSNNSSCILSGMNLSSYVMNPFTKEAYFDGILFKKHVKMGMRLMDDLVDLEKEKIQAIIDKIKSDNETDDIKHVEINLWEHIMDTLIKGRRVGFGITGEGDMLAEMDLKYDSDSAIRMVGNVHKKMFFAAMESSIELAKERGAFPIYDFEREKDIPLIKSIKMSSPELYEELKKYGRRNIGLITLPPSGSQSIVAQTTSGIEPVFMVKYMRRKKINSSDLVSRKITKNIIKNIDGDYFEEYPVFHKGFIEWAKLNQYDIDLLSDMKDEDFEKIVSKSPYGGSQAREINPIKKIDLLAQAQKWNDASLSNTTNLPKETTVEDVNNIYFHAWEMGCKGCTIYREGSRDAILLSNKEKDKECGCFKDTNAVKRPKVLESDIIRFQNGGEKWVAFVGKLDGKPYEVFTGLADKIDIPNYVDNGIVVKIKNGKDIPSRYDFEYNDKDNKQCVAVGINGVFNKTFYNYARLLSGILRHGMPLKNVIKLIQDLSLDNDTLNTWQNGIIRVLKRYVKDGVKTGEKCPKCESDMIYENGCVICKNCGYSKCS